MVGANDPFGGDLVSTRHADGAISIDRADDRIRISDMFVKERNEEHTSLVFTFHADGESVSYRLVGYDEDSMSWRAEKMT